MKSARDERRLCPRALQDRAVEVAQHDGMAVLGEDLGDAVAHRPGAEDGNSGQNHGLFEAALSSQRSAFSPTIAACCLLIAEC
jgi:hypothetical protein